MVADRVIAAFGIGLVAAASVLKRADRPSEKVPAWYEGEGQTVATCIYFTASAASIDADLAGGFGWTVQSVKTGAQYPAGAVAVTFARGHFEPSANAHRQRHRRFAFAWR